MIEIKCFVEDCKYSIKLNPEGNTVNELRCKSSTFAEHVRKKHHEADVLVKFNKCPKKNCEYKSQYQSDLKRHGKKVHSEDISTIQVVWINPKNHKPHDLPPELSKCKIPKCHRIPLTEKAAEEHEEQHKKVDNITKRINSYTAKKHLKVLCKVKDCLAEFGSLNHFQAHVDEHSDNKASAELSWVTEACLFEETDSKNVPLKEYRISCLVQGCSNTYESIEAFQQHQNDHSVRTNVIGKLVLSTPNNLKQPLNPPSQMGTIKKRILPKASNTHLKVTCKVKNCQLDFVSLNHFQSHVDEHSDDKVPGELSWVAEAYSFEEIHSNNDPLKEYTISCLVQGCRNAYESIEAFQQHQSDHDAKTNFRGTLMFSTPKSLKRSLNPSSQSKRQRVQE